MSEGGGALRELIAFLGFDVDTKPLDKADERLNKTIEGVKRLGEAVGAAFGIHEISEFIQGQVEAGAQLEHMSQTLGIATDDLQSFEYAASIAGVSADEAGMSLGFLTKAIGESALGNTEAVQTFQRLHVQLKTTTGAARPLADILPDIADGFTKLDPSLRGVTAMQLFGRAGKQMIPVLLKGRAGIAELRKEFIDLGGGLDEGFIKQAEEAEHEEIRFKTATKGLESTIASALLPTVTELVDMFKEGAKSLRDLAQHTPVVTTVMWTLAAAGVAVSAAWAFANIEIFLIIAAIALLALGVEDFIGFMEGKDSVIGDWLNDTFGDNSASLVRGFFTDMRKMFGEIFDKVTNELLPAVLDMWAAFESPDGQKSIKSLSDGLAVVSATVHEIHDIMVAIIDATRSAADAIHTVRHALDDQEKNNEQYMSPESKAKAPVRGAIDGLLGWGARHAVLGGAFSLAGDVARTAHIPSMISNYFGGGGGGDMHAHTTVNVTNNNNGGDPKAISRATQDGVSDALDSSLGDAFPAVGGGAPP